MNAIRRFFSWSLQKLKFAMAVGFLTVAGFGLYLFLQDKVDYELRQKEIARTLTREVDKLRHTMAGLEPRMGDIRTALAGERERATQATKVVRELEALSSGLNRLTTASTQLQENRDRQERMRQMEGEALRRAAELELDLKRLQWERDGLGLALGRLQAQIKSAEEDHSAMGHYAREAWVNRKWSILTLMVLCLVGPTLLRVLAFAGFAPLLVRRAPVLLGRVDDELPTVTAPGCAVSLPLSLGDTLWVRPEAVQAADASLSRREKRLLDWHRPFSWTAAGLTGLAEVRNRIPDTVARVTLAVPPNSGATLTLVTLPPETSLVLRAGFLAGLVGLNGRKVAVRRHWRPFHLQSWIRGQLGFLEFWGPCRLVIAATPGVAPVELSAGKGSPATSRQVEKGATVGFTPGLVCRLGRSAGFWDYVLAREPLFADRFAGRGLVLRLADGAEGAAAETRCLNHGLRRRLLGLVGL